MQSETLQRASNIRLLVLDCDGVLTDGRLYYLGSAATSDAGEVELAIAFHAQDGQAMKMLMHSGVEVAVISGRGSAALDYRLRELGVRHAYTRVEDKGRVLERLLETLGVEESALAVMGDDIPDLALFQHAALSIAPADASEIVRDRADHVTEAAGGRGAVRDAAMLILRAQNALDAAIKDASKQ